MKIHALQTGTVRCKQFQLTGAPSNLHRIWDLAFSDKRGPWMPIYCSSFGFFKRNWPDWFQPDLISYRDGTEGTFEASQRITGDGKVVAVPTPGHSKGHQSILVKGDSGTSVIGGDLTWNLKTLEEEIPDVLLTNHAGDETVERMHRYVQSENAVYLSAHDWQAAELLAANPPKS